MSWYIVELSCPRCGKVHPVWSEFQIPDGPTEAGTVAELYVGQELPEMLVRLMNDKPWCEEVQEYVPMDDPARVHLRAKGGSPGWKWRALFSVLFAASESVRV